MSARTLLLVSGLILIWVVYKSTRKITCKEVEIMDRDEHGGPTIEDISMPSTNVTEAVIQLLPENEDPISEVCMPC